MQRVLRSGVTGISVPGGTWFTDVGVRDAIKLGLMDGPRMHVAGRMIVTYGCIEDDEPSWEGTPDHSIGKLCNTADEMVTEVRRQHKHGVNFIKMADSRSGESQMLAKDEIAAVVGEAHRRNMRVGIHSRGAGSTRAAAEAGVDWIIHADLATDRDLEAVAKGGMPIIPTATFLAMVVELGTKVGAEQVQLDINRMKRHFDLLCELMHKARKLGIKLLVGTDTGNNTFMRYGELHAKELEIFVKYGGYTPLEAISAATRDNAFVLGLEGQVGLIEPGKLADRRARSRPAGRHHRAARRQASDVGDQGRQDRRSRAARRLGDVPPSGGIEAGSSPMPVDIARLRVEIDEVTPAVVRRVEVPLDIRLDDLHFVLQIAIGWQNCHPFEFRAAGADGTAWGLVDRDDPDCTRLPAERATLADLLALGPRFHYDYVYGEDWTSHGRTGRDRAHERGKIPGPCERAGALPASRHRRRVRLRDLSLGDRRPESPAPRRHARVGRFGFRPACGRRDGDPHQSRQSGQISRPPAQR